MLLGYLNVSTLDCALGECAQHWPAPSAAPTSRLQLRMARAWSPCTLTRAGAGYGGENCKSCVAGFYRLEDKCVACPSAAYMLIFVYAGAISECLPPPSPLSGWRMTCISPCAIPCMLSCSGVRRHGDRPHGLCPAQGREPQRAWHRSGLPSGAMCPLLLPTRTESCACLLQNVV